MRLAVLTSLLVALPAAAAPDATYVRQQLSDDTLIRSTFSADAHVFLPATSTTGAMPVDKLTWFTRHDDASFDGFKVGTPTTGHRGDATWYAVDVKQAWAILGDCPPALARCHRSRTLRLTELVIGDKTIAMHVDDPARSGKQLAELEPIDAPTDPGPLAKLLVDPKATAAAILDDPATVVLGTEVAERAVGPAAAKKLLGSWAKLALTIEGKPREVRTATWGYVAANLAWTSKGKTTHMRGTLFAVMQGSEWKVAAVHYSLPYQRVMYD